MKLFILLLTLIFATAVLADCCNFDVGLEVEVEQLAHENHDDQCQDVTENHHHNDMDHCGCTHTNHYLRIISSQVLSGAPLNLLFLKTTPVPNLLALADFKFLIFHPPKA